MPAPAHTRVTFSGVFGDPAAPLEIWQCNLTLNAGVFADEPQRVAMASALASVWSTNLGGAIQSIARLTRVRVAQVGPDGLVGQDAFGAYNQGDHFTNSPGNGVGSTYPLQTALCVSLDSARSGPSGRGRFFLPAPAVTLGADTRVAAAATSLMSERCRDFIRAVNDAWFFGGQGSGAPDGVQIPSYKGFLSPVIAVRVGRVLDTQRRRRGDLVEEHVSSPV